MVDVVGSAADAAATGLDAAVLAVDQGGPAEDASKAETASRTQIISQANSPVLPSHSSEGRGF